MKLLLKHIVTAVVFATLSWQWATAQEVDQQEDFDYRDFKFYKEEAEDDISLWGGLYKQPEEMQRYQQRPNYRYALSYATGSNRGFRYDELRSSLGALTIDLQTSRALQSLGYGKEESFGVSHSYYNGALAESSEILPGKQSRLYDRESLRIDLSGHNYLAGVTYRGIYGIHNKGVPLSSGWTMMTSARTRTGRDIYVDGVYTNALDLAIGASYKDHTTNLDIAILLPWSERGLRQASTEEAYTLTNNRLYNPTWGMQCGKVRNARVATSLRPELIALWQRRVTAVSSLTIVANIYYEQYGLSMLTWFNTPTPLPDNYKYMPSYLSNDDDYHTVEEAWRTNDLRYTQIDWERLYHTNSLQQNGHARYAVTSRRTNTMHSTVNVGFKTLIKEVSVECGIELYNNSERYFRVVDDMLGASHIIDHDYYIEDDATYSHLSNNNLRNPNNTVTEGERYGHDYRIAIFAAKLYAIAKWRTSGIDFVVAANMTAEHTYRHGYFEKELFAGSASYGNSKGVTLVPAMLTTSARYTLDRHTFGVAMLLRSESPNADDMFLQPEYNNHLIDNPSVATAIAADLSYEYLAHRLRLQARLFIATTSHEVDVIRYYDDLAREYVDGVISGIGRLHYGIEVNGDMRWSQYFTSNIAVTMAQYRYNRDPKVTLYSDDDNSMIATTTSSMRGSYSGSPQLTLYGDIAFRHKGWTARASAQFWGLNYVTPSPIRRTIRIVSYAASSEEAEALKHQERIPSAATLDVMLAKRIKFNDKLSLNIMLSARNILGSSVVYSSYEQNRVSIRRVGNRTNVSPFANRLLYAYPYLFSLSASLWF